jgi:hypothetical protein
MLKNSCSRELAAGSWRRARHGAGRDRRAAGGEREVLVSRLATVVGALSAIVTLADFLAARSFLSVWLHQQIRRGPDGWQISPVLNLSLMGALVGVVWLLTDSPTNDPAARKRLLSFRANILLAILAAWFLFGPSIGTIDEPLAQGAAAAPQPNRGVAHSSLGPAGQTPSALGSAPSIGPSPSQGHTSQYTWRQAPRSSPPITWRPGDGLRAMAQLLEDVATPPATRGR